MHCINGEFGGIFKGTRGTGAESIELGEIGLGALLQDLPEPQDSLVSAAAALIDGVKLPASSSNLLEAAAEHSEAGGEEQGLKDEFKELHSRECYVPLLRK